MDRLTSGPIREATRTSSAQTIGWWCLFDSGDAWEWGRAVLTNLYRQPYNSRLRVSEERLQHSANQVIEP